MEQINDMYEPGLL